MSVWNFMPCCWEPEGCPKNAAGVVEFDNEVRSYCREHLDLWRAELDRQHERDMPKLPGLQEWYVRAARKAGVMR